MRLARRRTGPVPLAKVQSGIDGLDEISGGGLPRGRPTLVAGGAGRARSGGRGARATHDHLLRLYVAGTTPRSARAIRTIRAICDEHLAGRYRLEVIDIYQRPALARHEQVVATPTLIRERPPPLRRVIGDLSDVDRVLVGLDLRRG